MSEPIVPENDNKPMAPSTIQGFMEKQWPALVRDIEFWSEEGRAAAEKAAAAASAAASSEPHLQCLACGSTLEAKLSEPPGTIVIALCDKCTEELEPAGCWMLKHAFETGYQHGVREQYAHGAPLIAALEAAKADLESRNAKLALALRGALDTSSALCLKGRDCQHDLDRALAAGTRWRGIAIQYGIATGVATGLLLLALWWPR